MKKSRLRGYLKDIENKNKKFSYNKTIKLLDIINSCKENGAKAVVLGCTELPNIIKNAEIEIINTTEVHCREIVKRILE